MNESELASRDKCPAHNDHRRLSPIFSTHRSLNSGCTLHGKEAEDSLND